MGVSDAQAMRFLAFTVSVWMGLLALGGSRAAVAVEPSTTQVEFFEKHVRPILVARCLECHGADKGEGGLRIVSRQSLLLGGDSGPAISPQRPDESLLLNAVGYLNEIKMPPSGKLPASEIESLQQWVADGAAWPETTASPPPSNPNDGFAVTPQQREWWAFQPVRKTALPEVDDKLWPGGAIDQFLLAAMEANEMAPSPEADRMVWLRRVTFDLTGLPPAPEEMQAFLSDRSPNAHAHVVDRLLASPAYGEKWARRWLDVVRYADYHDGDPQARDRACEPMEAWRYRDWVVRSFNADLPFDRFVVHQIAGDLLPSPEGLDFYADGLVATTFLSNGAWDRGDADKEKMVSDMVDDQIDTIGKAFLGLTLGCARCHDHKFDPISQADYYGLAGIFYSTRILKELGAKGGNYTLNRVPLAPAAYVQRRNEMVALLEQVNARLAELDKESPARPADDQERIRLVSERDQLESKMPPEPAYAEAASEGGVPGGLFPGIQDVPLHIRGSYTRLGEVVPRRLPVMFAGANQPPIVSGSGRLELANWIASESQPLTSRVIVNRLWQGHFSAGLAPTANNLGLSSQPPIHRELLDYLASELPARGWSLKDLHRKVVLSSAYRQAGLSDPSKSERDPENRRLSWFPSRRLDAEEIRDAMLFVSGQLDRSLGGPALPNLETSRRSLYVQTARWDKGTFASLFDAANPDASDEKRQVSTAAPQSLFLLNNSFTQLQASRFARRLAGEAGHSDEAVIAHTFRLAFCRPASGEELAIALSTVVEAEGEDRWRELAHFVLCANEFVYVD